MPAAPASRRSSNIHASNIRASNIRGSNIRASNILVVSAFAPELAPLVRWLEAPGQRRLRRRVFCQPVGIGAVDAAAGAAAALAGWRPSGGPPSVLVFVGTAGTYGAAPPVEAVAVAGGLHLVSGSAEAGHAYFPGPMALRAASDDRVRRELATAAGGAVVADVATPLAITTSRALARRLAAATRATVENLEVFAVARAAHAAKVPFGAVLGIANQVGPGAHRAWREHQRAASAAACAVVAAWIEDRLEHEEDPGPTPPAGRRRAVGARG